MNAIRVCIYISPRGYYGVGISPEIAYMAAVGGGLEKSFKVGGKSLTTRLEGRVVQIPQGATEWEFDGFSVRWSHPDGPNSHSDRWTYSGTEKKWVCDS
jgi:hypothetical protein